ncbi:MAG: hypothetical protein A2138_22970 [Deltaproteobacteria bacterium RBG_16_71_12]|nr:MAG: hypothetical protein A2138_22970 [Deltaproteobacteria bacterium RBG_16_71_12]
MRQLRVIFATQQAELADLVERGLAPFGIQTSRHDSLLGLYPAVLKEEPDVVLLDAELPRLALEAAVRFLRTKGASRRQPILLLVPSGDDAPDPGLLVTSCQADDFIERAAPYSKLARAITRLSRDTTGFDEATDSNIARLTSQPGQGKPAILIIDDDASIGQLLKRMLDARYDVTVVSEGKSAISLCASRDFAAVFCDLMMPGVSGADVYRAVRVFKQPLADRFIFVTAHALDAAEVEFFMGLSNHVVHKPFSLREILSVAAKVVPVGAAAPS